MSRNICGHFELHHSDGNSLSEVVINVQLPSVIKDYVTESGDDLALSVLKGITEEMKYSRNESAELPNQLRLKIH